MAERGKRSSRNRKASYCFLLRELTIVTPFPNWMWLITGDAPVFGIHECGGDDKVLANLAARVISTKAKQRVLGLILDADIEGLPADQVIQSRSLSNNLKAARAGSSYPLPAVFPEHGLIVDPLAGRPGADRPLQTGRLVNAEQ